MTREVEGGTEPQWRRSGPTTVKTPGTRDSPEPNTLGGVVTHP